MLDEARFVQFAPVRNRSKKGGVGFYQQTIERHLAGHLTQGLGVAKGDNARQRDMKSEVERRTGNLPGFGEAVHHSADVLSALFAHDRQRVVSGRPGMNDEWPAADACSADVDTKSLTLPAADLGRIAFGPVVVEPGLAGGNHLGLSRQSHERLDIRLERVGIVGVHADRGIEIGISLGQRQNSRKVLEGHRNAQGAIDPIEAHPVQDRIDLRAELREVEVAV